MPEPDAKCIKEWGDEIKRRFKRPVASTSWKGNLHTINLKGRQPINHVYLQIWYWKFIIWFIVALPGSFDGNALSPGLMPATGTLIPPIIDGRLNVMIEI